MINPTESGKYNVRCGVSGDYFTAYFDKNESLWKNTDGEIIVFGSEGREGDQFFKKIGGFPESTPTVKIDCTIATILKSAAKIREESFDENKGEYKYGILQAANIACRDNPELITPVYLLLSNSWNDSLAWAERLTK